MTITEKERTQAYLELAARATQGELRGYGKHPDMEVEILMLGDYADEGEPDLVVEVYSAEDIKLEAQLIEESRNLGPYYAQKYLEAMDKVEHLTGEIRQLNLKEYRYACSGCHTFTKFYSNTCPECGRQGYLTGSFSREDLEKWFDARQLEKEQVNKELGIGH